MAGEDGREGEVTGGGAELVGERHIGECPGPQPREWFDPTRFRCGHYTHGVIVNRCGAGDYVDMLWDSGLWRRYLARGASSQTWASM